MKGHIRERSPGHWAIILDVGEPDPRTGKKKRKWHSFTVTKREAQKECSRLITALHESTYVEPSKTKLAEFLARWLTHIRPQISPKTHERYAELVDKNIVPLLGSTVLSKLRTSAVDEAFSKALVSGRRDGMGGLSARTVHHMRRVLLKALNQAITWELLTKNPAAATQSPKVERKAMLAYDTDQVTAILDRMRPTRMYVPVLLAIMCGLRRGEIAALRWRNIDLERRSISIIESAEQTDDGVRYKAPKNERGRTVAISASVADELRRCRARQAEELFRFGIRAGDDAFVVAKADGRPIQPRSMTHEWMRIIQLTPLPRIRFHDLRHTHATQLLAAGVHPKVAQERLGHSTIAITLDLYSHVMPGMQEDAAEKVDGALRKVISGASKTK